MNGKIYFADEVALAKFLIAFTESTATFKVTSDNGEYVLEFTGGY